MSLERSHPNKNKQTYGGNTLADGFQSISTNESDEQKIAVIIQLLNNKTKQDMSDIDGYSWVIANMLAITMQYKG